MKTITSLKHLCRDIFYDRLYNPTQKIRLWRKWHRDRRHLPLVEAHRELYRNIHESCFRSLGKFPNLIAPDSFCDKIQWLKLFDQRWDAVSCADKIAVRSYISERVGENHLPLLYAVYNDPSEFDLNDLPEPCVIKTNHDSGSVHLVRKKSDLRLNKLRNDLKDSLERVWGWNYGEWIYKFISPKILVEEFLQPEHPSPPPDFKFHCVESKVRFLQYISDRGHNTKETIVDRNGVCLGLHFDTNMLHSTIFTPPENWEELIIVAEKLAKGWKYLRVDLYNTPKGVFVGELTFYPLAGCYRGHGQENLGRLLDFDRTTFNDPIYLSFAAPVECQKGLRPIDC